MTEHGSFSPDGGPDMRVVRPRRQAFYAKGYVRINPRGRPCLDEKPRTRRVLQTLQGDPQLNHSRLPPARRRCRLFISVVCRVWGRRATVQLLTPCVLLLVSSRSRTRFREILAVGGARDSADCVRDVRGAKMLAAAPSTTGEMHAGQVGRIILVFSRELLRALTQRSQKLPAKRGRVLSCKPPS